MLNWPVTLPQLLGRGWTETVSINVNAPEPRHSGAFYRGSQPVQLPVTLTLNTMQVFVLETFIKRITKGALPFQYMDPHTETLVEARFLGNGGEIATIKYLAPEYWSVSLNLELI